MAPQPWNKDGTMFYHTERPCFFKIILNDSIAENKLIFPRKFLRTRGKELSNQVILKVPSGVKWKIEIVKTDSEIWLQNGWSEFAQYYSIAPGSLLTFEYELGDSQFNVKIFRMSGQEIDYPFNIDRPQEKNVKMKEEENDAGVEISDHSPLLLEKQPSSNKRKFTYGSKLSKSKNPSFEVQISPHCLKHNVLYIPTSYIRDNKHETKCIKLKVNNRSWTVKLLMNQDRVRGQFSAGWTTFAKENTLKVRDVCIFELINNSVEDPFFNVSISRAR
ncbi:B3 domain-containing transcription factor VRN1-like [Euphorbia lathyris]|uniref:B3 domain-containing transcription factor VRN1-like n=1 Tax=Euphorbia lathyris TaxID=212925 RepID=UPI0033131CC2